MNWIAKSYDHTSHAVDGFRDRVLTDEGWKWQAQTFCGRTITGIGGGTISVDCATCNRSLNTSR